MGIVSPGFRGPHAGQGDGAANYLWRIRLAPGITATQAVVLVVVAIIVSIAVLPIPVMQPYVLQNQLHIDPAVYGRIAGMLAFLQNVVILVMAPLLGALGDAIGRKPLVYAAMAMLGLACLLYPFLTSLTGAILLNILAGLGLAAEYSTLGACVFAYPDNASRGGFVGVLLVTQGVLSGVMMGYVAPNLPQWFGALGASPFVAAGMIFWLVGLLCFVGLGVSFFGFEPRGTSRSLAGLNLGAAARALVASLIAVLRHAREQPRFAMLLLLSCAFRADLVVVVTFLSLWIVSAARIAGIDGAAALGVVGASLIVLQAAKLTATPVAAYLADRVDRSGVLLAALALGGGSFLSPLLVHDVEGWRVYAAIALIGVSEGVSAVSTQALLGQETPPDLRGSVMGAATVIGMLGAIGVNFVGGFLFDAVDFVAPFVMVGTINLLCLAVCLLPGKQSFRRAAQG